MSNGTFLGKFSSPSGEKTCIMPVFNNCWEFILTNIVFTSEDSMLLFKMWSVTTFPL